VKAVKFVRSGQNEMALLVDGVAALRGTPQMFQEFFSVGRHLAKLIENDNAAESQVFDQALMMQEGIPLALGNNPKLREEAIKTLAGDKTLRARQSRRDHRTLIPSSSEFGLPTLEKASGG
jgi:hypothetical protein